jgi:formyl-CoA transferase
MALPLDGVKVLDFTAIMAGPYCTLMLADMGADVVKIEAFPEGDGSRRFDPKVNGESYCFAVLNRNKQSVGLNMKDARGKEIFMKLARDADIIMENYRPGVTRKLGIDYDSVRAINPDIIYCSVSGFGQTGPYSQKGGFDIIAQGMSGIMSVTGEPDGPPTKAGIPITDLGAGLFALAGILAALHWRTASGRGQYVDTSLFEAGLALSVWEATEYFSGRGVPARLGSAHRMVAPYQAVRCLDGHINIGAANDRTFTKVAGALGHPEWVTDERFASATARVANRAALADLIEAVTITRPRAEWIRVFDEAAVPCGPILDYAEAFAHPQAVARAMSVPVHHPRLGDSRAIGTPLKLSDTPLDPTRRAPVLGEHTDEVLAAAGFSDDEIGQLRAAGVAR